MTLEKVKQYLKRRINTEELLQLDDSQLEKYFNTASLILNTFYVLDSITVLDSLALIHGEEMLFLFNSNIDLNLFYQYNGLTSFAIEGAVNGTVDYSLKGEFIPAMLKAILASLEVEEKIEDPNSKVKTGFTCV